MGPEVPHRFNFSYQELQKGVQCVYHTVFLEEDFFTKVLCRKIKKTRTSIAYFINTDLYKAFLQERKNIELNLAKERNTFIPIFEQILTQTPLHILSQEPNLSHYTIAVQKYLQDNFIFVPSIQELAAFVNISPVYLMRLFKKEVGITIHAYINYLRIEKAKEMIRAGQPLLQIAHDLGFIDQSHFSKAFFKITGVSPTNYQKGLYL